MCHNVVDLLCSFQKYYKYHVTNCLVSTTIDNSTINSGTQASECDVTDSEDDVIIPTTTDCDCGPLTIVMKQVYNYYYCH